VAINNSYGDVGNYDGVQVMDSAGGYGHTQRNTIEVVCGNIAHYNPICQRYGVYIDENVDHNYIFGKTFNHVTANIRWPASLNSNIVDIPFITRSHGASTGTGAQQTIAHGLDTTPNYVRFFDKDGTDRANTKENAAADATNIYPLAVNLKEYYWEAKIV